MIYYRPHIRGNGKTISKSTMHTFAQFLRGPLRGYLTCAAICVIVNESNVGVSQTNPDNFSSHAWAAVLTKRGGGYGCQAVYWEHKEYAHTYAQFLKAPLRGYSISAALCLTVNQSNVGLGHRCQTGVKPRQQIAFYLRWYLYFINLDRVTPRC